jgi:transmembrane sensor
MGGSVPRVPVTSAVTNDGERARAEAAGWLILLDDDPSDQARQAEFQSWLAGPGNKAAWESMSRTGALLAGAGQEEARGSFDRKAEPPPHAWRPWAAIRRPTVVAALIAICSAAALAPTLILQLEADHVTGTAQIRSVRLEDGSSVRLGPDSAIRLDFSPGERRVTLLSGEGLFDVTPDAGRPFRVITRDTTTTVLGTSFDVAMLESSTSVGVAHGRVQVDAARGGSSYKLVAGDWVRVGGDGAVEQAAGLPDYLTAGPGARLAVRNRPVAEVIERLRPWFSGRIVIASGSVGEQPVTGVFDAADPVRALEAIVGPQGGRVMQVTPWLLIVSKG